MPSTWLQALASIYVPLSIASALLMLADIFVVGRRQHMAIMDAVWPLTMLYRGPLGLPFYGWFGRAPAHMGQGAKHGAAVKHGHAPMWQATFKGATHCGAGCALGGFTGDWIAFALFGSAFAGSLFLSFSPAYLLGVVFQYFSIVPMRHLGFREGVAAAIKVDTLSLLAYEVGMFVVMGAREWAYPDLKPTSWSYWLLMQVAMVIGFLTTYPVNWWLIRRGIKGKDVTAIRTGPVAVLLVIALAGCARPPQAPFGRMLGYGTPGVESYGRTDQATTVQALLDRCRAAAPTGTNPPPQRLAAACDQLRRTSRNQPCAWSRSC